MIRPIAQPAIDAVETRHLVCVPKPRSAHPYATRRRTHGFHMPSETRHGTEEAPQGTAAHIPSS